jgi:RNA polymerase primary sigma factor
MHPDGRNVNRLMKLAIAAGSESAVRLHISRGDDLQWRDARGFTPLMIAAARDRAGVCRLLIEAGVDHRATDSLGRDALAIAREAGAHAAAEAIAGLFLGEPAESTEAEGGDQVQAPPPRSDEIQVNSGNAIPPATEAIPTVEAEEAFWEFDDYGEWEEEDDRPPPTHNPTPILEQSAVQRELSEHVPIDDAADWDDVEAHLPAMAARLAGHEDAEFQGALRSLVLRAAREGSVPRQAIEELYASGLGEGARDLDAEVTLLRILNDLGAEVDERVEYLSPDDDFRVEAGSVETLDERDIVDEALAAMSSQTECPKDPLRMQRRETQRIDLLTAGEEIELAKAMESAAEAALEAMAAWPNGLAAIAAAIEDARAGRRLVSQIAASGQEETEPAETQSSQGDASAQLASIEDHSSDERPDAEVALASTGAMIALEQLRAFAPEPGASWPEPKVVRQALAAIDFRRPFLLELSDRTRADHSLPAKTFRAAISDLRRHRDRMAMANLRLVFPLARKYMFSGLPIEDLSQEGNIGLLKAVDRFDWRRGFRFSTMATWWVRQAISRSIADSAMAIRLPVHVHEVASRFKWEMEALEKTLGRDPTSTELADRVGMPVAKVELLSRCLSDPLALDSVERETELERQDRYDAFAEAESRAVSRVLIAAVESLGKKNSAALKLRFGLEGVDPRTLEEVGVIFGVTRERARQIEAKALRALTHPARKQDLARALGRRDPALQTRGEDAMEAVVDKPRSTPPIISVTKAEASDYGDDVHAKPFADVRDIVNLAERHGIASLISRSDGAETTWIFLDQPKDVESLALAGSMLRMGFTYHPGKGYSI